MENSDTAAVAKGETAYFQVIYTRKIFDPLFTFYREPPSLEVKN
jgi:hypothetical protein